MEPAVFILAIMGCHEGSAICEPLAILPTRYESDAVCADAVGATAIQRQIAIDTDHPVVIVQCLRLDAGFDELLEARDTKRDAAKPTPRPPRTKGPWAPERASG